MKNSESLSASLVLLVTVMCSFTFNSNPVISFDSLSFDFGTMKQNEKVEHIFKFTNKGTAPLIISDVVKTCGCTTPEWPQNKPLASGENSSIVVKYDSKRVGPFNKEVIVKSNDPVNPELRLRITGTIEAIEDSGAPVRKETKIPGAEK